MNSPLKPSPLKHSSPKPNPLKPLKRNSPTSKDAVASSPGSWLEAIDHIQITSPPEAEAEMVHFYGTVLRLPELPKPDNLQNNGGAWYALGAIQLHIGLEQDARNYASRRHLCFQVKDLKRFRAHLETEGVTIIADTQPLPDCDRFYLRDPGGNRIEIICYDDNR